MSEAARQTGNRKEGVGEFIKKTRAELDKTTFPSSDDVKNTTIIVVISVIFLRARICSWSIRRWVYVLAGAHLGDQ